MDNKKNIIGLLTLFHKNYNYGGILQAYATYTYLTSQGYRCKEINYSSRSIDKLQKKHIILKGLKTPIGFITEKVNHRIGAKRYLKRFPNQPMVHAFDRFIQNEFEQTTLYNENSIAALSSCFDSVVVGGDQVWNPTWSDKTYFLDFVKEGNKIAFSCSIGKDKLSKKETDWINSNVTNLNNVSVREDLAYKVIHNMGVNVVKIPDPVFLLSDEYWRSFAPKSIEISKPYIFSYLLGDDKQRRYYIKKFARDNNLTLVTIPHVSRRINENDIGYADVDVTNAGPREFVGLISNASFVFTDSFHGTAFSLILNKPFRCFSRFKGNDKDAQNSRLFSILKEYDLADCYISVDEINQVEYKPLSDDETRRRKQITSSLRGIGQEYLNESLGEVR